jgi:hypothetical protein
VALVAFGGGALTASYLTSTSSVNAAQPIAAPAPGVAYDPTSPLGTTALAPTAVPTVQYITEPASAPVTRTVVRRAPAATRTVYRTSTSSSAQREPRTVRHTRSAKNSALIIGGSTVAGAGIGAIVDGKKGALIGGLIGAAGGTVYDRTTRHKDRVEY